LPVGSTWDQGRSLVSCRRRGCSHREKYRPSCFWH
jgi:hypothetical protein